MTGSNVEVMQPREVAPAIVTPMDMLSRAVDRGADIATIERLAALAERMDAVNARRAFDAAISEAKAEIPVIAKTAKGHNDRLYADFAGIARAVDPVLARHGLSYRFRTRQDDKINVTCVLSHRDGHSEETTLAAPADNSGSKNAIQSIGSTLTYLQRYSLVQALGLAAAVDDDGKSSGAGETIGEIEAETLRAKLAAVNGNETNFCKRFRVERLEDLPAKMLAQAERDIQDKARMNAGGG